MVKNSKRILTRTRRGRFKNRRSRRLGQTPMSIRNLTYSGDLEPGTIAVKAIVPSQQIARLSVARVQVASDQLSTCQLSVRGTRRDDILPLGLYTTFNRPRTTTIRPPRSADWIVGDGSSEHVLWITNLGSNKIRYLVTATVVFKDSITPPDLLADVAALTI